MDDGIERREGAIVHVGRGKLDVSERRNAEAEPGRLRASEAEVLAEIEGRVRRHTWTDLRHAGAVEALAAEEGAEVAGGTARLREEEERPFLRIGRDGVVVVGDVPIERGIGEGERGALEGGDGVRGVLEA